MLGLCNPKSLAFSRFDSSPIPGLSLLVSLSLPYSALRVFFSPKQVVSPHDPAHVPGPCTALGVASRALLQTLIDPGERLQLRLQLPGFLPHVLSRCCLCPLLQVLYVFHQGVHVQRQE